LYYTSLNIGSFVSILLTPWIKDHPAWYLTIGGLQFDSWHLAFGLSAVGLTLGLLNYGAFQHYLQPYGTAPDFAKLNWRKLGAVILVSLVIAFVLAQIIRYRAAALGVVSLLLLLTALIFIRLLRSGDAGNRRRAAACIIFVCISAIWAVYNQQIYTSLTLFALRNVRHEFLGVQVSAAQFQDLNQFWLVVLAAPLAWLYHRMHRSARGDFSIATKYAVGLYLLALAFFLYAASGFGADAGIVSPWWLVAGYAAQSLGELLISALGFSMVSQLVPERVRGIIMGAWFLAMGVSLYAGGAIAGLAHMPPGLSGATATLPIYMRLFGGLAIGALICALAATAAIPLLKSLSAPDRSRPALQPADR
ncbi:MAG: oligopeptide:H+ symporter, partial [Gammaproteobacteria bacterium]